MIILKLYRDQARQVQLHFFPYLELLCEKNIRDALNQDEELNARMIYSVLNETRILFEKKLFGISNKLSFKFTDAQSIVLYKLLLVVPIHADNIWLHNLRQFITDHLHLQLSDPV